MLVPAILYKEEIEQEYQRLYYSEEMMLESACLDSFPARIEEYDDCGIYQYAILNEEEDLVGYVGYRIDWYGRCVRDIDLMSFHKSNHLVGKAIFEVIDQLIDEYKVHRVEWKAVEGNPVKKSYDKLCKKYDGKIFTMTDYFMDRQGNYRDLYIYEIIRKEN